MRARLAVLRGVVRADEVHQVGLVHAAQRADVVQHLVPLVLRSTQGDARIRQLTLSLLWPRQMTVRQFILVMLLLMGSGGFQEQRLYSGMHSSL